MNSTLKSLLFWMVLIVVAVLIWNVSTKFQKQDHQISFSEFMSSVDAGNVVRVVITGQEIAGATKDDTFHTYAPEQYEGLVNKLIERGVLVQAKEPAANPWAICWNKPISVSMSRNATDAIA